ncbi:hypothetical protein MPSEU_000192000 [Mayamaea pseudoterrestris]|nr:hypothetical protein MPSEU_000192000 [Mayamaea pseudoterrestris]
MLRPAAANATLISSRSACRQSRVVNATRRRFLSDQNSTTTQPRFKTAADQQAYLRQANSKMKEYHETRELMRQGKLKSKPNDAKGPQRQFMAQAQFAVVGVFLVAFLSTPFLGRKIATDAAFREKWVPKWYDFTVKKPEQAWTRQELHEQAVAIQRDIRERAIRGEFTPEKLDELRSSIQGMEYPHRENLDRSQVPKEWDRVHPNLDDDE